MLALTGCGGTKPTPAKPESPPGSDDSAADSVTDEDESASAASSEELLAEWKGLAKDDGADPFPEDVVGFTLGMEKAEVQQACAKAKGKILDTQPLRCSFDAVLEKVFKDTVLSLNRPRKGWLDGGVSVELDGDGRVCGISVSVSGSDRGPVVPPSDLIAKLGPPRDVVDKRKARSARWYWEEEKHLGYAGWSHHLPGYDGPGGQRQWVSYCKHTISACHMFCSFLR
jgi:hypothetical protein